MHNTIKKVCASFLVLLIFLPHNIVFAGGYFSRPKKPPDPTLPINSTEPLKIEYLEEQEDDEESAEKEVRKFVTDVAHGVPARTSQTGTASTAPIITKMEEHTPLIFSSQVEEILASVEDVGLRDYIRQMLRLPSIINGDPLKIKYIFFTVLVGSHGQR